MPKIVKENIDDLNATLTITIEKTSYEPRFKEELKKYRKQANFKGFRQGKTPLSFVRKMYGKQVLSDVINSTLQETLAKFFEEDEDKYVGQPIGSNDQPHLNWDAKNLQDFVFKFDLGISPKFDIQGLSDSDAYEKYVVTVSDDEINKEIENLAKRNGERVQVEDTILENDMVKLAVKELDGDAIKEGGVTSSFSVLTSRVDNEDLKEELLTKKKGDTLKVNIFEIEDTNDENYPKKYFLNITEEELDKEVNPFFEATIEEVTRVQPAEVNQELIDKTFGEENEIEGVDGLKEKIREQISGFHNSQTEAVLFRKIQDELLEKNKEQMQLPDAFLKRWLVQANKKNTPEAVEQDYEGFATNLRWSLIKGKVAADNELKVEEQEIRNHIGSQMMQYMSQMGGLGDMSQFLDNMIDRAMQDENQIRQAAEAVMDNKVFDQVIKMVTIQENEVSADEFNTVVEKIRADDEAERLAAEAANVATNSEEEE